MDIVKYLKTVKNLNKYISFTSDIQNKRIDLKIPFNISTILALKDIRSIEIEYFNKCEENGGATKIVDFFLHSPPSKSWSLLGEELISLLQYWLEAIRKHLILHNAHWWTFLKLILKFLKIISTKDASLNKVLIEETAECLLDLATHSVPGPTQRSEILKTFNSISAEASRNIRFAYKEKFQEFFTRLATLLPAAGDLVLQYSILESLLRWLLPRHEQAVRRAAAASWFPRETYTGAAVQVFMERAWQVFVKDARDFLNAQNENSDLVTSVVCKAFGFGQHVIWSDKTECWLDLNTSTACLSILVDPRWELPAPSRDVVVVTDDNTVQVDLKLESDQLVIAATVLEPSQVYPFPSDIGDGDPNNCVVRITVSSRTDVNRLDRALANIFGEKYKMSLDTAALAACMSPTIKPINSDVINCTEEETRFSMPPEVPRRKHSGFSVRPRHLRSWNSPSTVSTSSLAQLHEKLAALPRYTFDKEPVSVVALPQLSTVSEVSETEENRTNNSSLGTIKLCRRYGVSYKKVNKTESKTSVSVSDDSSEKRNLSPVVNYDENSVSCLLLATVGSADDSVISDTIGRLPKNVPCNTDNIVDLLAQEALESHSVRQESGINIGEKESSNSPQKKLSENSECENPNTEFLQQHPVPSKHQVVDESSNEIVDTPVSWVQPKRPYKSNKNNSNTNKSNTNTVLHDEADELELIHNVEDVENFFSQHVTANRNGDIVISPTLARKINETSSECSEDFDQCILREDHSQNYIVQDIAIDQFIIPDIDIVECLNAMVDRVCEDLDKCVTYMDSVEVLREVDNQTPVRRTRRRVTKTKNLEKQEEKQIKSNTKENAAKPIGKRNSIKLQFPKAKPKATKKTSKPTKPKKDKPFTILSPIIERDSVMDESVAKNIDIQMESPKTAVPFLRRKRKLYSPKDETCHEEAIILETESIEDDRAKNIESKECSKASKSIATSYKDLEQERITRTHRLRKRLTLKKPAMTVSPRTSKLNQIFDSLKDVVDGEPVKLADKTQQKDIIYNYPSDSDDEEENKKTNLRSKKALISDSSKAAAIGESSKITKIDERNKKAAKDTRKPRARKTTQNRQKKNVKKPEPPQNNLEDERMRKATPEVLNTSFVIENPVTEKSPEKNLEPKLNTAPQMECISEDCLKSDDGNIEKKFQKLKTKKTLSLKRNKDIPKVNNDLSIIDNDRTVSPLPGLVVETVLVTDIDIDDSIPANMLQNCKDIYQGKAVASSEMNTTQNLLSDINEPIDYSPTNLNITEELNRNDHKKDNVEENKEEKSVSETNKKRLNIRKIKTERVSEIRKSPINEETVIQLSVTENNSEKSMATIGSLQSPITGHGDFNEDPPNSTLLNERIQPRMVEQEYLNQSIKDFFSELTKQLYESNGENSNKTCSISKDRNISSDGRSSAKSGNSISPVVAITRLSPEYIRSRVSGNSSEVIENSKSKNNLDNSKTCQDKSESNSFDCNNDNKTLKKDRRVQSTISPIKLGCDFQLEKNSPSTIKLSSLKLKKSNQTSSCTESENNCVKRIKNIFSTKKKTLQTNSTSEETNKASSSRMCNKNNAMCSPILKRQPTENEKEDSETSRGNNSSKASKRKSSPILRSQKKAKYSEENNNFGSAVTESGPSIASVEEWFKRNEPTQRAASPNLSIIENLKNVLEKIDTTLVEIHHNTSKRFIDMFVDASTQLNDLKARRETLQRQTAAEIMAAVVKVVDDKFIELNDRLQSLDDQFMESLKQRAHDLIREECGHKRAMVRLLREDVKVVMDHLAGG